MGKKTKAFAAAILTVAIVLASAACGSTKDQKKEVSAQTTGQAKGEMSDTVKVSVFTFNPQPVEKSNKLVKFLEKKFNVDLKVDVVAHESYKDTLNIKIAAGEYYDYMTTQEPNTDAYQILKKNDAIINISEYVDKLKLENLQKYFKDNESDFANFKENDGFYQILNRDGPTQHSMIVRKDWMDKLKLKIPKNYDEFKTFLKAMVEADLDKTAPIGMTVVGKFMLDHIMSGFTGNFESDDFGTFAGWAKVDGKWSYKPWNKGYKEGITFLRDIYKEGLLDKEYFLIKGPQAKEKFQNGKAALIMMPPDSGTFNAIKQKFPNSELATITPFPAGTAGPYRFGSFPVYGSGVITKKATEDARVRMLEIVDFLMSKEGLDLGLFGIQGIHYNVEGGKKVFVKDACDRDFGPLSTEGNTGYLTSTFIGTLSARERFKVFTNLDFLKADFEEAKNTRKPAFFGLNTDSAKARLAAMKEVNTNWIMRFITGEADINADWEKYKDALVKAGVNEQAKEIDEFTKGK